MDYERIVPVWELTGICDMGCKHCSASYKRALPDELNTKEALELCDEIADIGIRALVLSGGEAILRKDWKLVVDRLISKGLNVGLFTNGWYLNKEEKVDEIINTGVSRFGISIDGMEGTHDFIRKEGSFQRIMTALDIIKKKDANVVIATTITKKNLYELEMMKEKLKEKGIKEWQLQLGLPMGNFKSHRELVIEPEEMNIVIDFANKACKEDNEMIIYLGDCFGYYNLKRAEIEKLIYKKRFSMEISEKELYWRGCGAGRDTFGILPNGDVVGCVALRDSNEGFIAGNIRERSLKDILEARESFKILKDTKKSSLKGTCKKCRYGDDCLGGCPNPRILIEGDFYAENRYCTYNIDLKKAEKRISQSNSFEELFSNGKIFVDKKNYQIAELLIARAISLKKDIKSLELYSDIHYNLKNYMQTIETCEEILIMEPDNINAYKNMGLSYSKLGDEEKWLEFLRRSVELTDTDYMLPYLELAATLVDYNRIDEAVEILEEGRKRSDKFKEESQELYEQLCD